MSKLIVTEDLNSLKFKGLWICISYPVLGMGDKNSPWG